MRHFAISTPELFCAWRPGMKSSGKPWSKIVSGGVSAKDDKSVSDWSIQVRTTAGERAAYLACERVEALGSRLRHFGSAKVTFCAWADSKTTDWKKLKFNLVRQFGVNRAKILNGSGWTKCPVKFFSAGQKIRPLQCEWRLSATNGGKRKPRDTFSYFV